MKCHKHYRVGFLVSIASTNVLHRGGGRIRATTNYHSVFIFMVRQRNGKHFSTTNIYGLQLLYETGVDIKPALGSDWKMSFCASPTLRLSAKGSLLNHKT